MTDGRFYMIITRQSIFCKTVLLLPACTCPAMNSDHKSNDENTNTEDILCQGEAALNIVAS